MNYKIYISDVGNLQRQEEQSIALRKALYKGKAIDLENYHTYEEVTNLNLPTLNVIWKRPSDYR